MHCVPHRSIATDMLEGRGCPQCSPLLCSTWTRDSNGTASQHFKRTSADVLRISRQRDGSNLAIIQPKPLQPEWGSTNCEIFTQTERSLSSLEGAKNLSVLWSWHYLVFTCYQSALV